MISDEIGLETTANIFSQLAVLSCGHSEGSTDFSILLVGPATFPTSHREVGLVAGKYYVAAVCNTYDLKLLRLDKPLGFALLSDLLGPFHLRAAAEAVRRQWPTAKILILGRAAPGLEDHLYDEVIGHWHEPTVLLGVIRMLADNRWTKKMSADLAVGQRVPSSPKESDPTKNLDRGFASARTMRGVPSDEHHRMRAAG
jgi:hypothetical protein